MFSGEQAMPDDCNKSVAKKLSTNRIKVTQISLNKYWLLNSTKQLEYDENGTLIAGPELAEVVDELGMYVGMKKTADERNRQLMVSARAGLEAWVVKRYKEDPRLQGKALPNDASLKDKIEVMRDECPELEGVIDSAHQLRMIGNFSAHNPTTIIPAERELITIVKTLTSAITQADDTAVEAIADHKEEQAFFTPFLSMIQADPDLEMPQMHAVAPDPLPQKVIAPKDDMHLATVVFMHPFGTPNTRYLSAAWAYASKGIRFVFPTASPMPITSQEGKVSVSWHDYFSENGKQVPDPGTLEDTRIRLAMTLEAEALLLGRDGHKRLIVGGLAQGAQTALHAVLMHRKPVAGFIGVCCDLLPVTPPQGPGRLIMHYFGRGEVPAAWPTQTYDQLEGYHDIVDHGNLFDNAGEFNPMLVKRELEADCLRCAVEALMDLPDSGSLQRVLDVAGKRGGPTAGPAMPADPKEWEAMRMPQLQGELESLRMESTGARKRKLRALQLELHPDKQPADRKEACRAMFLLVQKEWTELKQESDFATADLPTEEPPSQPASSGPQSYGPPGSPEQGDDPMRPRATPKSTPKATPKQTAGSGVRLGATAKGKAVPKPPAGPPPWVAKEEGKEESSGSFEQAGSAMARLLGSSLKRQRTS
jgi:predicted esterase